MSSEVSPEKRFPFSKKECPVSEKQAKSSTKYTSPIAPSSPSLTNRIPQKYQCNFTNCIAAADGSAAALVNLIAENFPCFNDVVKFENRKSVRFLKRAQICVADLWAAFNGEGYGEFHDIDKITIFADYRIPQMLNMLGCLWYAPLLENAIKKKKVIESGHSWEIQLRGMFCILLFSTILRPKIRAFETILVL